MRAVYQALGAGGLCFAMLPRSLLLTLASACSAFAQDNPDDFSVRPVRQSDSLVHLLRGCLQIRYAMTVEEEH